MLRFNREPTGSSLIIRWFMAFHLNFGDALSRLNTKRIALAELTLQFPSLTAFDCRAGAVAFVRP